LFSQVLRLLAAEGMVSLGLLSLDGTKLAGNAAQKANRTLPQIEKILAEAAAADAADDVRHGDAAGAPTPRTLARRGRPSAEPPRANRNNTEPRANITAPDVRVMRNQKGYVAGYNGQAVVTADQVIVGAMLSQHPVDRTLLHPLLDTCRRQLAEAGIDPRLQTVLADAGYASEETFARAGAARHPDQHFRIPICLLHRALCDRLIYTSPSFLYIAILGGEYPHLLLVSCLIHTEACRTRARHPRCCLTEMRHSAALIWQEFPRDSIKGLRTCLMIGETTDGADCLTYLRHRR
jgi:Transposase DDE domain